MRSLPIINERAMKYFKQFTILTKKNFIVMKRSLIWTILEIAVPILIGLPITISVTQKLSNTPRVYGITPREPVTVYGSYLDRGGIMENAFCWSMEMCTQQVLYSYAPGVNPLELESFMNSVNYRFFDREKNHTYVIFESFNSTIPMLEELEKPCFDDLSFDRVGIIFTRFDPKRSILSFDLLYPDILHLGMEDEWINDQPYAEPDRTTNSTQFLSTVSYNVFSHALNSEFVKKTRGIELNPVTFTELPEAKRSILNWMIIFQHLNLLIGVIVVPVIVHTTMDIGMEREIGIKDFLSVSGVGPAIFYLSHIFIGWLKCVIVLTIVNIPVVVRLAQNPYGKIDIFLYFCTLWFYSLGSMASSVMVASLCQWQTSNATIKVSILVQLGSSVLTVFPSFAPSPMQNGYCYLWALNFNAALGYAFGAMGDYLLRNRDLSFTRLFEDSPHFFPLGSAMCMILFDILWMLALTSLVEYLVTHAELILFVGRKIGTYIGLTYEIELPERDPSESLFNSHEKRNVDSSVDVYVDNVSKIWNVTGDIALDRMTMKAQRGEVTVLVGHNGAGKSTLFSVICGLTPPTSGRVEVEKQCIGLCPQQGTAFYEQLTVYDEHLWLYHQIKGGSNNSKKEITELLEAIDLFDKRNSLPDALSGGMKRKLCLLLALIGDSRIVLLDEPTAGMDTGACADVKKMLEVAKKHRTILLTTHNMEEAESIGDVITIMDSGRSVASGSPHFLKKRFGDGYLLKASIDEHSDPMADNISRFLQVTTKFVPSAKVEKILDKEMVLILPNEDVHRRKTISNLMSALECQREELGLSKITVSLYTMEGVFLRNKIRIDLSKPLPTLMNFYDFMDSFRVAELVKQKLSKNSSRAKIFNKVEDRRLTGPFKFFFQLYALLRKRVLYSLQHWQQLSLMVVVPTAIAFLCATQLKVSNSTKLPDELPSAAIFMDLKLLGRMRIAVAEEHGGELYARVKERIEEAGKLEILDIPFTNPLSSLASLPLRMPPIGMGMVVKGDRISPLINYNAYHPSPVFLNLLANVHLGQGEIKNGLRTFNIFTAERNTAASKVLLKYMLDYIVAGMCIVVFSLVTSAFAIFIVDERTSKFAHLQSLTGLSPVLYWLSILIFDIIVFLITSGMIILAFVVGGWGQGQLWRVFLAFLLYFYASVPMVYMASCWMDSFMKAYYILVIWQSVSALGSLLLLGNIALITHFKNITAFMNIVALVFPPYAMAAAVFSAESIGKFNIEYFPETIENRQTAVDEYHKYMSMMAIFGSLNILLFILTQSRFVGFHFTNLLSRIWKKTKHENFGEDCDVMCERKFVQTHHADLVLEVKDLSKDYGSSSVLQELTFGVKRNECFGLLGLNGAGKTTTFEILTGRLYQSSGTASIRGSRIDGISPIGYCPQFDAMLPDLTGREILEILATLYGYKNPRKKADSILKAVMMGQDGNKMVKHYSGGQKRKVSVGIAVLAQTELMILDEPTTGIDPEARHEIWSLLCSVRDHENSSLLLTSHSMDECGALCTKIAVLVKGRMVAVGTSEHLKTRYSKNFILSIRIPDTAVDSESASEAVRKEVLLNFTGSTQNIEESNGNLLKFSIPKSETDTITELLERAKGIADTNGCSDCFLEPSTLEETFKTLSRVNDIEKIS